jgi:hypothetical protein
MAWSRYTVWGQVTGCCIFRRGGSAGSRPARYISKGYLFVTVRLFTYLGSQFTFKTFYNISFVVRILEVPEKKIRVQSRRAIQIS